jgi:hypothetical protein
MESVQASFSSVGGPFLDGEADGPFLDGEPDGPFLNGEFEDDESESSDFSEGPKRQFWIVQIRSM